METKAIYIITGYILIVMLIAALALTSTAVQAHDNLADNVVMHAEIPQGTDGMYYISCIRGCEYFYELGEINDLYQPFPSSWQAYNYFLQVRAAYEGVSYVPLPPPMSG